MSGMHCKLRWSIAPPSIVCLQISPKRICMCTVNQRITRVKYHRGTYIIAMAQRKAVVTLVLAHWNYHSLTLNHWYALLPTSEIWLILYVTVPSISIFFIKVLSMSHSMAVAQVAFLSSWLTSHHRPASVISAWITLQGIIVGVHVSRVIALVINEAGSGLEKCRVH